MVVAVEFVCGNGKGKDSPVGIAMGNGSAIGLAGVVPGLDGDVPRADVPPAPLTGVFEFWVVAVVGFVGCA